MVALEDVKKLKVQVCATALSLVPRSDLKTLMQRGHQELATDLQELKDELQSRGLDTSGLKAVLVERLEEAIGAGGAANGAAAEPAAEVDAPETAAAPAADGVTAAEPAAEVGLPRRSWLLASALAICSLQAAPCAFQSWMHAASATVRLRCVAPWAMYYQWIVRAIYRRQRRPRQSQTRSPRHRRSRVRRQSTRQR